MIGVSVVIPTAGGRSGILQRSLRTLLSEPIADEVIVVVDNVDESTRELLSREQASDARLRVIKTSGRAGGLDRGQANRDIAVSEARGDLLVALDDDVEPSPGLVRAHTERHGDQQCLVVVGYMPVAPVRQRRGAMRAAAQRYSDSYERECRAYEAAPDCILQRLWGGNISLRRAAWLAATEDAGIGGYHVDREFGLRLRALGMNGVFDRQLRAVHHYRRTATELLDDALSSGIGQARLQWRYPELKANDPSLTPNSGPRSLLWRGRSRFTARTVGRSLALASSAAGLVGAGGLEMALVRAVWTVGFGRGVYEAAKLNRVAPDEGAT